MILVAFASKYGATREIAERIARTLTDAGAEVDVRPVAQVSDVSGYDAFVIGAAAYIGHWMKDAVGFVENHRSVLAERPVWLFSSGPLGSDLSDEEREAMREAAVPDEFAEIEAEIRPRGHRVFYGVLDPNRLGLRDRLIRATPAGKPMLPEGDFRDWAEIEAWAGEIARELDARFTA